jgi:tRNA(Ile)-lysidine synthase
MGTMQSRADSPDHGESDLLPALLALTADEGALIPGEGLLIALSGGADSVALVDLLLRLRETLGLRVVCAHMDHGLRAESAEDVDYCRALCARLDVPLHVRRTDVARAAARRRIGQEAAGRLLRYRWLQELRRREGLDRIATAHHLDDHVETLLMWLFRGTGLRGLRGIAPVQGRIVRPLRGFRRQELHQYLRWRGLEHREDPSNRDPRYLRNQVRHELLPTIERIFGARASDHLANFARRAIEDLDALEGLGRLAVARCRRPGPDPAVRLERRAFLDQDDVIQFYALRAITAPWVRAGRPQAWTEAAYRDVLAFCRDGLAGKRWPLPGGGWVLTERDSLDFLPPGSPDRPAQSDAARDWASLYELQARLLPSPWGVLRFLRERTACFDADTISPPLRLRRVGSGDRMRPFGMQGHKELSTLLRERGVRRELRGSQLVLEDATKIIWAIGLTTAEETRIGPQTKRVLEIGLVPRRDPDPTA